MENLAPEDSTVKKGRESGSKSLKISLGRPQVALSGFIAIKLGVKLRKAKIRNILRNIYHSVAVCYVRDEYVFARKT